MLKKNNFAIKEIHKILNATGEYAVSFSIIPSLFYNEIVIFAKKSF